MEEIITKIDEIKKALERGSDVVIKKKKDSLQIYEQKVKKI